MGKMKRLNLKHMKILILFFAGVAFLPFFFQSCGEPLRPSADLSSVSASAPFAFEEKVDQVAYMSCSGLGGGAYDQNAFFTFKVRAAKEGSGLRLRSDFVYATRNLSISDKAEAISKSPQNQNVALSLAIRDKNNLKSLYVAGQVYGSTFFGPLGQSPIASALANNNGQNFIRSFSGLGEFSDTILFSNGEPNAETMRSLLKNNSFYLALTYNNLADSTFAPAVPADGGGSSKAYGHGYKMNFEIGFGLSNSFAVAPAHVMTGLSEINLQTGLQESSQWECKRSWVFMIVRPQDLGVSAVCPNYNPNAAYVEPTPANAIDAEALQVLRSVLPSPSDWVVDLPKRCLIPKKPGLCYGSGVQPINYIGDGNTQCPTAGSCAAPHYVSICQKR